MSYLALARKWRPQDFDAICGQEHVTQTLKNAISQDRVHHAFLFCGARGVGKTTAARVLAKALNCVNGPTDAPCGTCPACTEIAQGVAMDVLEIDGASNRGIGEIRELRDGVAYAPQRDRTKIYIIDEVHMLTSEAFNALLKTLEEPPPHVKFIFATTEPQKIPVTILSRCQRFDFKRIGQEVMGGKLRDILEREQIQLDDEALRLVVRESEGSMRDALSLLDRIISFSGADASAADVARILGVADRSWLLGLVSAALSGDASKALVLVQEIFDYGVNLKQLMHDLVHYVRDIIVLKVAAQEGTLTDLTAQERETLTTLGAEHPLDVFQRIFRMASATVERVAQSSFPRLELEMVLVRMCELRPVQPIDSIVARLGALERRLANGAPPLEGKSRPFEPPAHAVRPEPTETTPSPREERAKPPEVLTQQTVVAPTPAAPAPSNEASAAPEPEPVPEPSAPPPAPVVETAPAPQPAPVAEVSVPHDPPSEETVAPEPPATPEPIRAAPAPPEAPPAPIGDFGPTQAPPTPREGSFDLSAPADARPKVGPLSQLDVVGWERFVDQLRAEVPALAATYDHGELAGVTGDVLTIAFERGSFNGRRATEQVREIATALEATFAGFSRLEICDVDHVTNSPFMRRRERHEVEMARRHRVISEHPVVTAFVETFDGNLTQVRVFDKEERHGS